MILGFIFAIVIIPLLDSITSLAITAIEALKSYLNVIILKNNSTDDQTCAIGFAIPNEEEEYDEL